MGEYTEFHFNVELKHSTPVPAMYALQYMLGLREEYIAIDHPFFQCARWKYLFTMDSEYFPALTCSKMDTRYGIKLSVRSNLKNYDGEIEKFLDWIAPYIQAYPGDFLGFHRFYGTGVPVLIFYGLPDNEVTVAITSVGEPTITYEDSKPKYGL